MSEKKDYPVLLIDSDCAVCNRSVQFIREHLRKNEKILFRSLFKEEGKKYLSAYGFPSNYDKSVILIENGKAYQRSDAVLRTTKKMRGLYPLLSVFLILPRGFRDYFYTLIAKHRHRFPLK